MTDHGEEDARLRKLVNQGSTSLAAAASAQLTEILILKLRTLTETIVEQGAAAGQLQATTLGLSAETTRLTGKIESLTRWLLGLTVAIGAMTLIQVAMTLIQVLVALKVIGR